ncbi:MAG TPA: hexose kinase [Solirubrobacteraceae bacterium]
MAASPSVDKLFEVDRLTPGDIHRPLDFLQVPGGKGLNVARAVSVLGESVLATGLLAGHVGKWIQASLRDEGVAGRFAWAAGETRSSLSVADRETGGLTEFYEAGSSITSEEWDQLETLVTDLLPQASWLSLSGSLPAGAPDTGYAALVAAAHAAGVPAAVDARGAPLARALDASPELVKINVAEAGELLGESVEGVEQALAAALEIRRQAGGEGRAAVVTMGAEGVVLVDPGGAAWRGRLHVHGHYPVGSGDAFLAGLLTGRSRGSSWRESVSLALGAATANAQEHGAGRFDPWRAAILAAESDVQALDDQTVRE